LTRVAPLADPDNPEDGLALFVLGVEQLYRGVSVVLGCRERKKGGVSLLGYRKDGRENNIVVSKEGFVEADDISTETTDLL
jgi:hypothetical protein